MDKQALNDLLTTLEAEGVVLDRGKIEVEANSDSARYSNLAVKILSIFGGLVGSFFFVLFMLLLGVPNSSLALLILGVLFLVSGIIMSRVDKSIFLDTINICTWLTGIGMIGFGLADRIGDDFVSLTMILLGTLTFFLAEKFLLQFLSALLICASMVVFLMENDWSDWIHLLIIGTAIKLTYLHLNEAKLISKNLFFNAIYAPLRLALIFSLIGLLFLVGKGGRMNGLAFNYLWLSSTVIIGTTLFSIYTIMQEMAIEKRNQVVVMTLATVMFLPSVFSPFIAGAILILILNYHIGYRTGIAIGVIALVYSVSQYYYDLNLTLLQKSGVLILSGLLFLLAYFVFQKRYS
ncbi:MAG: DUF4401 domain-containing protein [Bacteroidota bacterium]